MSGARPGCCASVFWTRHYGNKRHFRHQTPTENCLLFFSTGDDTSAATLPVRRHPRPPPRPCPPPGRPPPGWGRTPGSTGGRGAPGAGPRESRGRPVSAGSPSPGTPAASGPTPLQERRHVSFVGEKNSWPVTDFYICMLFHFTLKNALHALFFFLLRNFPLLLLQHSSWNLSKPSLVFISVFDS